VNQPTGAELSAQDMSKWNTLIKEAWDRSNFGNSAYGYRLFSVIHLYATATWPKLHVGYCEYEQWRLQGEARGLAP